MKEDAGSAFPIHGSNKRFFSWRDQHPVKNQNLMSIVTAWADSPLQLYYMWHDVHHLFVISPRRKPRVPPICSHYCNRKLCRTCFNQCLRYFQPLFHTPSNLKYKSFTDSFFLTLTIKLFTCEYHRYINSCVYWQYKVYVTWGFMKVILQYIAVIDLCRRVDLYVGLSRRIADGSTKTQRHDLDRFRPPMA